MAKQKPERRRRRGEGSIKTRPDGTKVLVTRLPDGKKSEESLRTKDPKEAELRAKRILETNRLYPIDWSTRPATIQDMEIWIAQDYDINRFSSFREVEYRFRLHIHPFFGKNTRLDSIKKRDLITAYLTWRKTPEIRKPKAYGKYGSESWEFIASDETINKELDLLIKGFGMAVEKGALHPHQVPKITKYPSETYRKNEITNLEIPAIHKTLTEYEQAPYRGMELTGWRSGTIKKLRWDNVQWNRCNCELNCGGRLYLPPGFTKSTKRNPSPEWTFPFHIYPNGELGDLIRRQRALADRIEKERGIIVTHVFFWQDGSPMVQLNSMWKKACKAAKIAGKRPHDFRSTCARRLTYEFGLKPRQVCNLIGWKSLKTYYRYCFVNEADVMEIRVDPDRALVPQIGSNVPASAEVNRRRKLEVAK